MATGRLAALMILAITVAAIPQYGFARPDMQAEFTLASSGSQSIAPGIDPVITGGRGSTVTDAGWAERANERHRCLFCNGYQAFPQN